MRSSAGLVMIRRRAGAPEVFLVHPGGPFFAKRDDGAWSIPKGLVEPGEDAEAAAARELEEETGFVAPGGPRVALGEVRQKGGKVVRAWAVAGDVDPDALASNTFELEWPPRSGRRRTFPEVDRVAFFDLETARRKVLEAQRPLVERACAPEVLKTLFG